MMSSPEQPPTSEPMVLTVPQTVLLLVSVLAVLSITIYLLYAALAWTLGWNAVPEEIPLPKPVIVSNELTFNFLSPHEVQVKVRNDGVAGLVRIELRSWTTTLEAKRSESGLEKSFRETFTTELAPPPLKFETKYHSMVEGSEQVWLEAGEEKTVRVQLASYNWADMIQGTEWSASAYAIQNTDL